ncbi:NADP-dependent oxidoreductase domain [Pseudocohnilembus persalinus]|uniref:NADP-dependent oxidoreductase domain n=1 Tax=Pseudocohnilembus persalinus TaxID=266149 RepID=A0A0V0QM99_PSEPJ|nr:NADP-dependent oxidoreductase domain [Pseudocohnilembus persalinus]|eukprot:KRX03176.1 NADP-dependent oxidoreductase domain [Pseudocohnilembus persalinus]
MQEQQELKQIPRQVLSNTKTELSRIGLGCMGLSANYTNPASEEEGIELIGKALEQGQNFFDTAYIYGKNEELLAKAIKKYGREKFFLATKFPALLLDIQTMSMTKVPGTVENIKKYCAESLKRLEIDQIDLYYAHRIDDQIPIEKQVQGFKELIEEGKVKYYGLSEASEDTIRRAHKYYPLTAVQEEYSLSSRDVEENGVLKACEELGIALVAYSPIGRGMLTGQIKKVEEKDFRNTFPRFQGENFEKNMEKVNQLQKIADSLNATPSQVALAWLLKKSKVVFPIPGTKRIKYLIENQNAASLELSEQLFKQIDELFPYGSWEGDRGDESYNKCANISTPPLN